MTPDHPHPRRRLRRRTPLLAVLVAVLLGSTLVGCESTKSDRAAVINMVNATRTAHGLKPLAENYTLDLKADAWAQKLRDECDLSHSRLSDGAPKGWRKLGENVGYGGDIAAVHNAYLNSSGHRANILDSSYNQMGAAAVWGHCQGFHMVFTVQVFVKL